MTVSGIMWTTTMREGCTSHWIWITAKHRFRNKKATQTIRANDAKWMERDAND